jgi:hypothetical protein
MSKEARTEDLVSRLREFDWYGPPRKGADELLNEAAAEIERLRVIEGLARELVTTGMSLRFTSGPALSVIEKYDKSDPHYQLCKALDLTAPRART